MRFPPQETRAKTVDALRELHVAGSPMIQGVAYYVHTGTSWELTGGSHEILSPSSGTSRIYIAVSWRASSGRAPVFPDTATEASIYAIRALYGHEQVPEARRRCGATTLVRRVQGA